MDLYLIYPQAAYGQYPGNFQNHNFFTRVLRTSSTIEDEKSENVLVRARKIVHHQIQTKVIYKLYIDNILVQL